MLKSALKIILAVTFIISPTPSRCAHTHTPQNTKFAFDFHGVIVVPSWRFAQLYSWDMIPAFNTQLPSFAWGFVKLTFNQLISGIIEPPGAGEQYKQLCEQNNQMGMVRAILDIANNREQIQDTIAIMQELKNKGYEIDIASNIGATFWADLETRKEYQPFLSLISFKKYVDYLNNNKKIIYKPDLAYFAEYQRDCNPDNKQIIFIDDRQKNVIASEKVGMIGIHFKNPQQLRQKLVALEIL